MSGPANITVLANNYSPSRPPISSTWASPVSLGSRLLGERRRRIQPCDAGPGDSSTSIRSIRPPGLRPNPTFGRVDRYQSTGFVRYRALYVKFRKRFSHRNQFLISYMYKRESVDNNPLSRYINAS